MKNILKTLAISTPCTEDWDNMDGDERKRFCGKCQRHVHNLTEYSTQEAEALIAEGTSSGNRTCVRFYRDAKGRVVTNNCPVFLRRYKQRLIACKTAVVLFLVARGLITQALAQGLVGAPVDPRYGQSGEVGVPLTPAQDPDFFNSPIASFWTLIAAGFTAMLVLLKIKTFK
jgi:hypothetical protein